MSEFGRRAASNGSWGTDHGAAAPMFIFGSAAKAGITGTNPDLYDLDRNNLRMQHDYRQVFGAIVQDWFNAAPEVVQKTRFEDFVYADQKLDIIGNPVLSTKDTFIGARFFLSDCYPNPASSLTSFRFRINQKALVKIQLFNAQGKRVKQVLNAVQKAGEQQLTLDVSDLRPGIYHLTMQSGSFKNSKALMVK